MIQNQKIIAILFSAVLALIPLSVFAQLETEVDSSKMDNSLVQVAFRTVEQQNLLGGVSVVDVEDLMTRAYSLNSLYYLDAMVGGVDGMHSWGMNDAMIVVDGIPRDDNNVLPSEIEQVTVLKGAQAIALYGSRAAKGVIQITTKRGKVGDLKISVRANTGFNVPKSYPKYLGSAEYMTLYNEARANDGLTPSYTPEQIYNYGSGINPARYPDLNFYNSDYLRKAYNTSEAMTEITGGSNFARYYTTMGYYREGSILKVGNAKDDNITRMFIRGNVDMNLHELITAYIDANATFYNVTTANTDFWGGAANLRPNRISPLIPLSFIEPNDEKSLAMISASSHIIDGKYFLGGTQLDPTNPIADAYAAGTGTMVYRQFQFNGGVNFNLKNVLDGMFFRAKYAQDYYVIYEQAYNNNYATFEPTWVDYAGTDVVGTLTQFGLDSKDGKQNISDGPSNRMTTFFSGQFDYTKEFSGGHNLFAMLMGNGWVRKTSSYQAIQSFNLGLQLSYNYNHKYYADFTSAVPYSTKMPKQNRFAFSPTVTLGWRLSNENFMSNQSVFDDLMLTASAGILNTDLDIVTDDNPMGYYLFRAIIEGNAWWRWGDGHGQQIMSFRRGENLNLGFVKRKEVSAGLKGSLLNKSLTFDANYFNIRMDGDIVQAASLYPSHFIQTGYPTSNLIPYVNYNIDDRQGVDFSVNYNQKINNDMSLKFGVNGMYVMSNVVKRDENYEYDYQTRMGRPLNQIWGLQNLGFFQSQDEINNSPTQTFGAVQPGDLKYKDQNGDGVIDSNDEVFLGSWNSTSVLGVNLTLKWKKLTLFAMGTGYFGGYSTKSSDYYWAGRSDRKYSEIVRDRWTEATKTTATYPRLTTTNGDNSFRASDFWLYKNDQFNLSMVQITYDIPMKAGVLSDLSVYVGGYNLLTLAKEREHLEMAVGSAPNTRFYNLGVKATF